MDRIGYSVSEACAQLGNISRQTLYRRIKAGDLDARKIAGRTIITGESIHRLVNSAQRVAA